MCEKILSKLTCSMHNTYRVTKVLFKYLKVPASVHNARNSVFCSSKRNCSTQTEEVRTNPQENVLGDNNKKKPKKRTIQRPSEEILQYLYSANTPSSILDNLPPNLLKRSRCPEALYIVDDNVAENVFNLIASDVLRGDVPVFEVNAGFGLISRRLLKAGVKRLHLCDFNLLFSDRIKRLQEEFPDQIVVSDKDLLKLGTMAFQDYKDGGSRVKNFFQGLQNTEWEDDPGMKIIGVIPSMAFIRYIIQCHVFDTGFVTYGRPEFYFLMSPVIYYYLTCGVDAGNFHYRAISVLFQLIFNYQLIEKFSRQAFLPWEMRPPNLEKSKLKKVLSIDPGTMYLVKIVPRQDFFQNVVPRDQVLPFWYFVRHHMRSRKNRVIADLEKWIPGCGPRIIQTGKTIFTEFGDLPPEEILTLFHMFVSWPEYPLCPFIASMESSFIKMQDSEDLAKEFDNEEDEEEVVEEVVADESPQ